MINKTVYNVFNIDCNFKYVNESGIYKIKNKLNGKCYIGSTTNLKPGAMYNVANKKRCKHHKGYTIEIMENICE